MNPGRIRYAYDSGKNKSKLIIKFSIKMKQDIKNKEPQERQTYVPASVKVIEVTARKVLCGSNGINDMDVDDAFDGTFN